MGNLLNTIKRYLRDQYKIARQVHTNTLKLENRHIKNCKVLIDRYEILQYMPKNAFVAEVGVLAGDFSERILIETNPQHLYLIDTFFANDWDTNANKRFSKENHFQFIKTRFKDGIEKHQIDVMKGFSDNSLATLKDNSLDWIYIDAHHSYDCVSADLKEARRVVKPNGFIIANDYIFYSHLENDNYGVIHAVNEMCVQDGFEIVYLALHPQMYCDVVMCRIRD